MRKCVSCGFINRDARERCLKCGAELDPAPVGRREVERAGRRRGPEPSVALRRVWNRAASAFGRWWAVPLPENLPHRFPMFAGLLSVVPGAGQLYCRQPRKALRFAVAFVAALAATVHFITTPYAGNLCIAAALVVVLLSVGDAISTAARINGQIITQRQRLALALAPAVYLGLAGIVLAVMTWLQWPLLTLFQVRVAYMAPAVERGDRIAGEGLTYWFREPRPGDVVRYDPPRWFVSAPSGDYVVNPQSGWERVMAVGGETLERRGGAFFVDGRPLAPDYLPLKTDALPSDFALTCPDGEFIVLVTAPPQDAGLLNLLSGTAGAAPPLGGAAWLEACLIEKRDVFDRAVCIYSPAPRRRFFAAEGPRFAD